MEFDKRSDENRDHKSASNLTIRFINSRNTISLVTSRKSASRFPEFEGLEIVKGAGSLCKIDSGYINHKPCIRVKGAQKERNPFQFFTGLGLLFQEVRSENKLTAIKRITDKDYIAKFISAFKKAMTDDMETAQRQYYESSLKRLEQNSELPFSINVDSDKNTAVLSSAFGNQSRMGRIRIGNKIYATENTYQSSKGVMLQLDENRSATSKKNPASPEMIETDDLIRSFAIGISIS